MNPIRTCIVCRKKQEKQNLIKIAKTKNGTITFNGLQGRGLYICNCNECLNKMFAKKVLNKVWKKDIDTNIYQQILSEVDKLNEQRKN